MISSPRVLITNSGKHVNTHTQLPLSHTHTLALSVSVHVCVCVCVCAYIKSATADTDQNGADYHDDDTDKAAKMGLGHRIAVAHSCHCDNHQPHVVPIVLAMILVDLDAHRMPAPEHVSSQISSLRLRFHHMHTEPRGPPGSDGFMQTGVSTRRTEYAHMTRSSIVETVSICSDVHTSVK